MRRLAAALAAFAFAASLSSFAVAGDAKGNTMMTGGMHMGMGHKCGKGQHWVKGYTKKNGTKVKGYCR